MQNWPWSCTQSSWDCQLLTAVAVVSSNSKCTPSSNSHLGPPLLIIFYDLIILGIRFNIYNRQYVTGAPSITDDILRQDVKTFC